MTSRGGGLLCRSHESTFLVFSAAFVFFAVCASHFLIGKMFLWASVVEKTMLSCGSIACLWHVYLGIKFIVKEFCLICIPAVKASVSVLITLISVSSWFPVQQAQFCFECSREQGEKQDISSGSEFVALLCESDNIIPKSVPSVALEIRFVCKNGSQLHLTVSQKQNNLMQLHCIYAKRRVENF